MSPILTTSGTSLGAMFLDSCRRTPNGVALDVSGRTMTYRELGELAGRIASTIAAVERPWPRLGAVFASRSEIAYAGVLGTLISGAGYVPLNPKFPAQRNGHMLEVSGSRTLVVGNECIPQLPELLTHVHGSLHIIVPAASTDELSR